MSAEELILLYVPMPLNAAGDGPADPDETVRVEHQLWDADTNTTVFTARDEASALQLVRAWSRRTPPAMSADHIPDASPAVTDVGKLIQAPLVGRLVEALTELLSALSPLSVMGKPIAALDTRLSRAISDAVMLVGSEANPTPIKPSADTGELRKRIARIVDPSAFDHPTIHPQLLVRRRVEAKDKADAILDLIQSERAG